MKMTLSVMALLLGISAYASAGDAGRFDAGTSGRVNDPVQVCMVKRTVQPHTTYVYDYQGKTYHFCCSMCLAKFKADPDHLKMAIDPVSEKPVDKASAVIYSDQGHAFFFESESHMKKFAKHPEKYRAKADQPS